MQDANERVAAAESPRVAPAMGWHELTAVGVLGALLALGLFEGEENLGHGGLAVLGGAVVAALVIAGRRLLRASGGARGQVLVSTAVLLVPIAAHGLARTLGFGLPFERVPATVLDLVAGPWFPVQVATAAAAVLAWRAFRITFLATPLVVSAWFAVQDAAPLLYGGEPSWPQRALLSAIFGVVVLAAGVATDRRERGDLATWLYLEGLVALTGGLVTWTGASTVSLVLVALIHAGLVLVSLLLDRRAFAVAGALGMAAAAGHLADDLLETAAVSFALAAVALALAGLGFLYHLHRTRLAALVRAQAPSQLLRLLPPGR